MGEENSNAITGDYWIATDTQTLAGTRYSRKLESQADADGVKVLEAAGYQRSDMAAMLRMLGSTNDGIHLPAWMSSHPDPEKRARAIEKAGE